VPTAHRRFSAWVRDGVFEKLHREVLDRLGSEGRLPSRRIGSGQRVFDRADLDTYHCRPATDNAPVDRVEALHCRVSGSTGQESSLADQETMLRESATGVVFRVYKDRGSGVRETRAELDRMLDDVAKSHFTVVRVVWRERLARFGVARIEVTCRWSGLRSRSCGSMATHRWGKS
jgi:predicted site-specific integrase-resolvase